MSKIIKLTKPRLKLLAALCLTLSFGLSSVKPSLAAGSSPVQTEDKTGKQVRTLLENCLKQGEQLDYLVAKVAALEKLDTQGKELVAALDAQVAAQTKTIAALKAANASSDKIEVISDKELKSYQASLADAQKQIERWKSKAGFRLKLAWGGTVLGIALGFGLALLAGK